MSFDDSYTRGRREQSLPTQLILPKRLMVFIDGANLSKAQKENDFSVGFSKFIDFLSDGYDLIRVYYYTGIPGGQVRRASKKSRKEFAKHLNKQLNFLDKLELDYNFEVVKKPLAMIDGKIKEKGVDVRIASDIIWHGLSDNYDAFVLVSGDKDLMDCLVRMKDNGKRVIVANFEGKISRELKKLADRYVNLSDKLEVIGR